MAVGKCRASLVDKQQQQQQQQQSLLPIDLLDVFRGHFGNTFGAS